MKRAAVILGILSLAILSLAVWAGAQTSGQPAQQNPPAAGQAAPAQGALDPVMKELLYIAVSVTNGCPYCIASHTAAARNKGMTPEMFHELMSVVGMANESNRLANGYQIEIDEQFK